jgi:hypothetical protein
MKGTFLLPEKIWKRRRTFREPKSTRPDFLRVYLKNFFCNHNNLSTEKTGSTKKRINDLTV